MQLEETKQQYEPKDDLHYNTIQKSCTNHEYFYTEIAKRNNQIESGEPGAEKEQENQDVLESAEQTLQGRSRNYIRAKTLRNLATDQATFDKL